MQAIALGRSFALGRRRPSHMCLVCVCLGLGIEASLRSTLLRGGVVSTVDVTKPSNARTSREGDPLGRRNAQLA